MVTDKKNSAPKVPSVIRKLSQELQPVEFADVVYGESTDVFGGRQLYLRLIGNVFFLNGFMLLFSGIFVRIFETHMYFRIVGWIFVGLGAVMLIVYVFVEWLMTHQSMKTTPAWSSGSTRRDSGNSI